MTFTGWLGAATCSGTSPAGRLAAAQAANQDTRGTYPSDPDLITDPEFSGENFTTPAQWLAAEWGGIWRRLTDQLVQHWEVSLADTYSRHPGASYATLGHTPKDRGRHHDAACANAVAALFPRYQLNTAQRTTLASLHKTNLTRPDGPPPETIIKAPTVVCQWLANVLFDSYNTKIIAPAYPDDPPQLIDLALGIVDPFSPNLDNLPDAFSIARAAAR
jgi:hypothetical protein